MGIMRGDWRTEPPDTVVSVSVASCDGDAFYVPKFTAAPSVATACIGVIHQMLPVDAILLRLCCPVEYELQEKKTGQLNDMSDIDKERMKESSANLP